MGKPLITRAEAQAFRKRWQSVNAFTDDEVRKTTAARKLQHLSSLYNLAVALGWLDELGRGEDQVWSRWQELRMNYARSPSTSQSNN